MKYLVISFVIYFVYKFLLQPTLKEPDTKTRYYQDTSDSRNKGKNPRVDEEEYTDYEEVD